MGRKKVKGRVRQLDSIKTKLYKLYSTPGQAGAFSGIQGLYHAAKKNAWAKKLTVKDVESFLSEHDSYTINRPAKKTYKTEAYQIGNINDLHQCDLMDMTNLYEWNKPIKFLLCIVDAFSDFAVVKKLESKSAKDVTQAFKEVYSEHYPPLVLESDAGT